VTFLGPLKAQEVENCDSMWQLTEPLIYVGATQTFVVPAGFTTDLGSVPWWATWLVPRDGKGRRAYVLHDWLYRYTVVSRKDADGIMRRAMKELGCGRRRWYAWFGVRVGGMFAWNNLREDEVD